jgi:hypothetical protein
MAAGIDFSTLIHRVLHRTFSSRPWLAVSDIDQGAAATAAALLEAGATEVLSVGVSRGIGGVDPSVNLLRFDHPLGDTVMDSIREADRLIRNPPRSILEAVNLWDSDTRALAIVDFLFAGGTVCGRPTFGARLRRWEELEDKTLMAELVSSAGLGGTAAQVVSLTDQDALTTAHTELASDLGTVWAVDNSAGWHGGGHGTYWVVDQEAARLHSESLSAGHSEVRVMPFLEGIPCSIHGMVHNGEAIAFRPMELFVYRDPAEHRLVYAKAGSYWDPSTQDRHSMRMAARRLGAELHRRVAYRGVFTLDGIMSRSGFVPTEVNTRFGGALPATVQTSDGKRINLFLLNLAIIEGLADDLDSATLESWLTNRLDEQRWARGMFQTPAGPAELQMLDIGRCDDGLLGVFPDDADRSIGNVVWGPRGEGGTMFVNAAKALATGPSSASVILELAQYASRLLGADLPLLEPAQAVR